MPLVASVEQVEPQVEPARAAVFFARIFAAAQEARHGAEPADSGGQVVEPPTMRSAHLLQRGQGELWQAK